MEEEKYDILANALTAANTYPNPDLCPQSIKNSLNNYIVNRVPTGDFLRAVLENNLRESIGRADDNNLPVLHHIVSFLYNECPAACWGSPEKVKKWLNEKGD